MKQHIDLFLDSVSEDARIKACYSDDDLFLFLQELRKHLAIFEEKEWAVTSKMKPQLRSILRLHLKKNGFPEEQISETVKACFESYEEKAFSAQGPGPGSGGGKYSRIVDPVFPPDKNAKQTEQWLLDFIANAEKTVDSEDYHGKVILPGKNDVDVLEMAKFFATRGTKPVPAICKKIGVQYQYDVVHTTKWFAGQVSTKVIVYEHKTQNHSSRRTYNCFRNPLSLLWIAVVLGENDETLIRAAAEMNANRSNLSSACAAVRRVIPFDRIMVLWKKRPD